MASAGAGNGGDPSWSWLGLLKWSLAYTDGTVPSEESMQPMSDEDKAFLEAVMKDGIVNEGERMKFILQQLANTLDAVRAKAEGPSVEEKEEVPEDELLELLDELRDIVEQIDYAKMLAAMKGLDFLLGCVSQRGAIPKLIRMACLGILATMAQSNPPVQLNLLELGSIRTLTELYFAEAESPNSTSVLTKVLQALSSNVRSHAVAETVFCKNELGVKMLENGLGVNQKSNNTALKLKKRSLFFLRALVTSDYASQERVQLFATSISHIVTHFVNQEDEPDAELREMSLSLLIELLRQKQCVPFTKQVRDHLESLGTKRMKEIGSLDGDEREYADVELEYWSDLKTELSKIGQDDDINNSTAKLMIKGP